MKHVQQLALAFAVVAFLGAGASSAAAQEQVEIQLGFSELIRIPGDVENVVVGDPATADVLPFTQNAYVLNARQLGTTNVIALDDRGNQLYYARIVVRPVDVSPRRPVRVYDGIRGVRRYICGPAEGCALAEHVVVPGPQTRTEPDAVEPVGAPEAADDEAPAEAVLVEPVED